MRSRGYKSSNNRDEALSSQQQRQFILFCSITKPNASFIQGTKKGSCSSQLVKLVWNLLKTNCLVDEQVIQTSNAKMLGM